MVDKVERIVSEYAWLCIKRAHVQRPLFGTHERKCLSVTRQDYQLCTRLPPAPAKILCCRTAPRACVPSSSWKAALSAPAARLPGTREALQPAVREHMPG